MWVNKADAKRGGGLIEVTGDARRGGRIVGDVKCGEVRSMKSGVCEIGGKSGGGLMRASVGMVWCVR